MPRGRTAGRGNLPAVQRVRARRRAVCAHGRVVWVERAAWAMKAMRRWRVADAILDVVRGRVGSICMLFRWGGCFVSSWEIGITGDEGFDSPTGAVIVLLMTGR